jgi:trehalose 6-phosphate phosphatase
VLAGAAHQRYRLAMSGTGTREQPDHAIKKALARSAASGACGFYLDFDGTLSPIGPDPDAVQPVPGVIDQLGELAGLAGKVGIISARPVHFLASRFGDAPGISLYGLYGLEAIRDGAAYTDPAAESWISTVLKVRDKARQELPADVFVEDKRLAVAFHYRQHPERRAEVEAWARSQARESGLMEQQGRMVIELKPPIPTDKGTVLRAEVKSLRSAWYFGDDVADAKGFEALRSQQERDPGFIGVCVAVANTEVGQELAEQADFSLASPMAMPAFLAEAIAQFSAVA